VPGCAIARRDPQLERAVAEITPAIEREPRTLPQRPADPVKTPTH
jgi:hypothetical protein